MRRAVLIAGRELKNEQGAQEVGERMAPALHYLSPSQWEKSTPGRPDENLLFLSTGCSVYLLLCLGCDSYSCVRRDAQVKAHLCHRGAVTTSASRLTEVMRILPNDSGVRHSRVHIHVLHVCLAPSGVSVCGLILGYMHL